jgi:hypothetical protein
MEVDAAQMEPAFISINDSPLQVRTQLAAHRFKRIILQVNAPGAIPLAFRHGCLDIPAVARLVDRHVALVAHDQRVNGISVLVLLHQVVKADVAQNLGIHIILRDPYLFSDGFGQLAECLLSGFV